MEDLKVDIKTCGDLMNAIQVKLEQKPHGRGTRRMLLIEAKKVEAQMRQLILDLAALPPRGPASLQTKQKVSSVFHQIEQQLKQMLTNGFLD
jgi:hypothetical protein